MDNEVMNENRYSLAMQLFFYQAIHEWKYSPNTRLENYIPKQLLDHHKEQNLNLLNEMKRYIARSIITHYFVLLYELVNGNFDESLKKSKNDFITMKFKIDANGSLKTINAKQLLDIIRQSFAHNDDEKLIPNWMFDNDENIIIHRKLKKNEIEIKIHITELVSLGNMYLINAEGNSRIGVKMYAKRLSDGIMQKRVNTGNIHKFVGSYDIEKKVDIPLDKLQKRALYNFFIKSTEGLDQKMINIGIHPYDPSLLGLKYPFKCNAANIIKDYQRTLSLLSILDDTNLSKNQFMTKIFNDKVKKEEAVDLIEMQDYLGVANRFEFCIASNILYSIFSYMEPSKIESCLNRDIDFKKLRNSIIHGRFYYNYEDGFNFYDGIIEKKTEGKSVKEIEKNIEYVATLTLNDINTLTQNLIHEYILANKKIR